jgi:PPOX class probable F420-dependent enzyme
MAAMTTIPATHVDLLDRPLIGHLATVSPKGRPQSNPMWYEWDGARLRFTHTSTRRKYAQLRSNPHLALSILDPAHSGRYLEVRAVLEEVTADPTGAFYAALSRRYGGDGLPPPDAPTRVVLVARPTHTTTRG